MTDKFIALSGGFDNLHIGHVRMINDASELGRVIILLNSDEWLIRKKGYFFMPFVERKEVLDGLRNVYLVLPAMDEDSTVCKSIENLAQVISYFGNGGDRVAINTPETEVCNKYSIPVIYGLGGNKVQSSTNLAERAALHA